jgi:hypothetical protein
VITPAQQLYSSASFVTSDTSTQGTWQGIYGADGYLIANSSESIPAYVALSVQSQATYTWLGNTTDTRALQVPSAAGRIASCWYSPSTFSVDINLTDRNSHRVAFYALDWDSYAGVRAETVQVLDAASETVLDTRSMTNFTAGTYLVWNISGHVTITVTMNAGGNGVISGIFFDPVKSAAPQVSVSPLSISLSSGQTQQFTAQVIGLTNKNVTWSVSDATNTASGSISASGLYTAPATISVSRAVTVTATGSNGTTAGTATVNLVGGAVGSTKFVGMDTTTQGSWKGVYGGDGWAIVNDSQSIPSYAAFAVQNQLNYTWASPTADPRALESGVSSTRIAATWYNAPSFNFDVNITDGNNHQIAVYALDWDGYGGGRTENVQIADANTGTVLDSRSIANFTNGIYLIWNISGHVKINVILTGGGNAVVSGLFWGSAPAQTEPTISWSTPTAITYGTALSGTQLDAVAMAGGTAVTGSYAYTPSAGTILGAGSHMLSVTFTPSNTTLYTSATASVTLAVNQATPVIVWATPAPIASGTMLSGTQLNAIAGIPGTFLYTPASGLVPVGEQTLSVTFTPTDAVDYKLATAAVTLVVNQGNSSSTNQAAFVGTDTVTQGTWKGTYGGDGYAIANDSQSIPGYATFAVSNQLNYTWASVTTDGRALQSGVNSWRTATTWYSGTAFTFDVNVMDGNSHQIALYAVDWDDYEGGRSELIQIVDGSTNAVLDSRNISGFAGGDYLIWNISGHVKIQVVLTGGGNAVVSGAFLDTLRSTGNGAAGEIVLSWSASASTATSGYNIYRSNASRSGYARINSISGLSYTDATVESGQTYYYVVTAVDSIGDESTFSNEIQANVP